LVKSHVAVSRFEAMDLKYQSFLENSTSQMQEPV
jgi:hypothetical protein